MKNFGLKLRYSRKAFTLMEVLIWISISATLFQGIALVYKTFITAERRVSSDLEVTRISEHIFSQLTLAHKRGRAFTFTTSGQWLTAEQFRHLAERSNGSLRYPPMGQSTVSVTRYTDPRAGLSVATTGRDCTKAELTTTSQGATILDKALSAAKLKLWLGLGIDGAFVLTAVLSKTSANSYSASLTVRSEAYGMDLQQFVPPDKLCPTNIALLFPIYDIYALYLDTNGVFRRHSLLDGSNQPVERSSAEIALHQFQLKDSQRGRVVLELSQRGSMKSVERSDFPQTLPTLDILDSML